MTELGDVFEDYLRSLSDDEWDALVARVRTPPDPDDDQPPPADGSDGRAEARKRLEKRGGGH